MDISGVGGGSGLDFQNLKEMMRGKEGGEGAEEALAQSVTTQVAASASVPQAGGVMSRNFVSAPKSEDETSYAQKTLAGKQAASAQVSRQNAVLNSAMAQMDSADSYAARNLAGKRAARSIMQEMQRTVQEESERNLKENRNTVEAAADQAATRGSAAPDDTAAVATASVPVAASKVPAPEASVSEPAPAAAPSTPSIDVTV